LTFTITREAVDDFTSTDEVTSSREMKVRVEARLTDRRTGTVIWQDNSFVGEESFSVSSDPLSSRYYQRQAFISIAQDIARRVYSKTMERF
jgi:hypothetical protein